MHRLARLDHSYVWHPFTQMREWLEREPIVIVAGKGAVLRDARRREYLDANSSIWTNLHGHGHPRINRAVRKQLRKIAHSSALGLANEPASVLAAELVAIANRRMPVSAPTNQSNPPAARPPPSPGRKLAKVFFSDDGSTAMEVALKLAWEYSRRTDLCRRPQFVSLAEGYHGDTVGAVSLGHIDLFHKTWSPLLFKTDKLMSPYCYRCPFNRAKPERADAREYRRCNWECVDLAERKFTMRKKAGQSYAAFVFEPLIQGAAGMIAHPAGWLRRVTDIARGHGTLLIADEVMTAFGRTGHGLTRSRIARRTGAAPREQHSSEEDFGLFASHQEGVQPDFICLAKGLSGGYLPMAATLTTEAIFSAFLGRYDEFKTFFHGHSYTANQLGAAAALANLEILQSTTSCRARVSLQDALREDLQSLWRLPNVGDVRQVGLVAGVELVRDWRTREPFDLRERAGIRVCEAMARRGVLTRPVGNVIVLMPPYCTTRAQLRKMIGALADSIATVFGRAK